MIHRIALTTALALGLTVSAFAGDDEVEAKKLTVGDEAPQIEISHWLKGEKIKEFEKDKVYVVEFWATWCGPCIGSMPHLSEVQEKYKDYDVTVLSVSDEPLQTVVSFLFKENKADGKIHNDRTHYTLTTDPDKSVYKDYMTAAGQRGIPTAFIVGKDTHIEWIGHPMGLDEPLEAIVHDTWDREAYLAKFAKQAAFEAEMEKAQQKMMGFYQKQDFDGLLGMLDEMIEKYPDQSDLHMQKFGLLLTELDRPEQGYAAGRKLLKANWDDAGMLNWIAWLVVDEPSIKTRDLDFALKAANRANELTENKDPAIIDTVARIYYEKGDYKAVKWQTIAAENAGDDQMGNSIREALEKYKDAMKK